MAVNVLSHNCRLIVLGLTNLPEIFLNPRRGFDSLHPTWTCFVEENFSALLDTEVAIQAHLLLFQIPNFSLCAKIRNDRIQNHSLVIYIRVLNLDLFNDALYTLYYARCTVCLVPKHDISWGTALHMQTFYAIKLTCAEPRQRKYDCWIMNWK